MSRAKEAKNIDVPHQGSKEYLNLAPKGAKNIVVTTSPIITTYTNKLRRNSFIYTATKLFNRKLTTSTHAGSNRPLRLSHRSTLRVTHRLTCSDTLYTASATV